MAEVITSPIPTPVQKFGTIRPGVSFPRMRDFARQIAHQKVLVFWGVLATRYSQGPWTDFDAKCAKTRGSAQGCAVVRIKMYYSLCLFSALCAHTLHRSTTNICKTVGLHDYLAGGKGAPPQESHSRCRTPTAFLQTEH